MSGCRVEVVVLVRGIGTGMGNMGEMGRMYRCRRGRPKGRRRRGEGMSILVGGMGGCSFCRIFLETS